MTSVTPIIEFTGPDSLGDCTNFDQLTPAQQIEVPTSMGEEANRRVQAEIAIEPDIPERHQQPLGDYLWNALVDRTFHFTAGDILTDLIATLIATVFWLVLLGFAAAILVGIQIGYTYYVGVVLRPAWELWILNALHRPTFGVQIDIDRCQSVAQMAFIPIFVAIRFIFVIKAIRNRD
jgi:hypothetical protein